MHKFFKQYFHPDNIDLSLIIEDDGRVAYAYILQSNKLVGDVWLYNQKEAPLEIDWENEDEMPPLNPASFISKDADTKPIESEEDVEVFWFSLGGVDVAKVYIRKKLVALISPHMKPGYSLLVSKDGPVALKYEEKKKRTKAQFLNKNLE